MNDLIIIASCVSVAAIISVALLGTAVFVLLKNKQRQVSFQEEEATDDLKKDENAPRQSKSEPHDANILQKVLSTIHSVDSTVDESDQHDSSSLITDPTDTMTTTESDPISSKSVSLLTANSLTKEASSNLNSTKSETGNSDPLVTSEEDTLAKRSSNSSLEKTKSGNNSSIPSKDTDNFPLKIGHQENCNNAMDYSLKNTARVHAMRQVWRNNSGPYDSLQSSNMIVTQTKRARQRFIVVEAVRKRYNYRKLSERTRYNKHYQGQEHKSLPRRLGTHVITISEASMSRCNSVLQFPTSTSPNGRPSHENIQIFPLNAESEPTLFML